MRLLATTIDVDWVATYEALLHTEAALGTHAEDHSLRPLLARASRAVEAWRTIEDDGRRLRVSAIRARATVGIAAAALRHEVTELAKAVLQDVSLDAELYRRLFPEPHDEVLALGLEDAERAAQVALEALEDPSALLPGEWRAFAASLRRVVELAAAGVVARADAYAALGRHEASVEAWYQTAAAVQEAIQSTLIHVATSRGLGDPWVESFFEPSA